MKRIVRKVVTYQCSVCRTEYTNKKEATACEKIPIQKPQFKKGDTAWFTDVRTCCSGYYYPTMKVVRIIGPAKSDHSELGGHLFIYRTRYRCPRCKTVHENDFWPSDICGEPKQVCVDRLKKLKLEVR